MKIRRSLFYPIVLSLAVAILASVVGLSGNKPSREDRSTAVKGLQDDRLEETKKYEYAATNAQTAIMPSRTSSTSTSSTTTTTATPALVSIKGIVSGSPESVSFSGQAELNARVVTDPDFGNPPRVVLSINLSDVTGVGQRTKTTYVTSDEQTLTRPLAATDTVQMTFPFYPSDGSAISSRTGMASFNLSFDENSLTLTGVTGAIGSP